MNKITDLSRIDRAIADNLSDIKLSFDDYAGIVQDFVVFITHRIKRDLFGYTRFTLQDFCKSSGRNRQDLAIKHPLFTKSNKKAPEIDGFKFETVFDYALIVMMQRNLVFKESYQTKERDQIIQLESIRIISDVRLNVNRKTKEVKVYEVKISPELLEGFVKRYYTLDPNAYRLAGKGRGGDSRKSFLIYLSRLRHMLFSQNQNIATVSVDVLCEKADITAEKSFHRKESLRKILTSLRDKAKFPYDFEFVSGDNYSYQYFVKLVFHKVVSIHDLKNEHLFYYALIDDLRNFFHSEYSNKQFNIKEPFQVWLTRPDVNTKEKLTILKKAYYKFFATTLADAEAYQFLKSGFVQEAKDLD